MRIGNYVFNPELAWQIGEKIVIALVILLVTWLLAKAARWAFDQLVARVSILQKTSGNGESIGSSLGKIVALLIWLAGLTAILGAFEMAEVLAPMQGLLNTVVGFVPELIAAGLIFFIGHMIAKIVKDLVVTALQTVDFDKWASKGGVDNVTGNSAISSTVGTIIYVLIIIPVAISAIDTLGISAVAGPATDMLNMILGAVPNIIVAALLLGIGYLIANFAGNMLKDILDGLGADRSIDAMGVLPDGTSFSDVVGRLVQIAILLFVAIGALNALNFPQLTAILDAVLELGGKVIFGGVVIGAGFFLASLLAKLVAGTSDGSLAATIVKWATTILFTFMGLEFMGVGDEIVRLAFGALVVGAAVAGALAFGLGGRDWAAKKLENADKG